MLRSVGLVFLLNAGVAAGTLANFKTGVTTTDTNLKDIKKSIEEYHEGCNKVDQILQTPVDANTSRNCVIDKINKTRLTLALFKKVTYFPTLQSGATVLDEKLEKINKSFVEKTMKVPPTAKKSNETQVKYTKKYMKKIETKGLKRVNKYLKRVASALKGIAHAEKLVATFPSQKANVDSMAGKLVTLATVVNTALTPAKELFAKITTPMVDINTQIEPFKKVANLLRGALKTACDTLTLNAVMKAIDQLHGFITKDFCIDAANACVGGGEYGARRRVHVKLPEKCLSDVVGNLKTCKSVEDLLNFKLCGTVPDACVSGYCISDYATSMKVCTDTNFAQLVMDQLKAYMPKWDIPLPFDASDFSEFTNTDFSKLAPEFPDLDELFANYPEILVNMNFHGNKPNATEKADGSAKIEGKLAMDITNGTNLKYDDGAMMAMKTAIAEFFSVSEYYVQSSVTDTARRLSTTAPVKSMTLSYDINMPMDAQNKTKALAKASTFDADAAIQMVKTKVTAVAPSKYAFAKDAAQDPANMIEVVTCQALASVTYDSACDSFVNEAFAPNATGCWLGTRTPTSFSKANLDSLCACPQKVDIIARIDQEIKCGLQDDDIQTCTGFTKPGQTWGSMIVGCATTFADVKAAGEALEAKKIEQDAAAASSGGGSSGKAGTTDGSATPVASVAVLLALLKLWAY